MSARSGESALVHNLHKKKRTRNFMQRDRLQLEPYEDMLRINVLQYSFIYLLGNTCMQQPRARSRVSPISRVTDVYFAKK